MASKNSPYTLVQVVICDWLFKKKRQGLLAFERSGIKRSALLICLILRKINLIKSFGHTFFHKFPNYEFNP